MIKAPCYLQISYLLKLKKVLQNIEKSDFEGNRFAIIRITQNIKILLSVVFKYGQIRSKKNNCHLRSLRIILFLFKKKSMSSGGYKITDQSAYKSWVANSGQRGVGGKGNRPLKDLNLLHYSFQSMLEKKLKVSCIHLLLLEMLQIWY